MTIFQDVEGPLGTYVELRSFSAEARPDDGRPRIRAFIESLHGDVMANGPAAYGVHYSPLAPPTVPMHFVDMRAAYEALNVLNDRAIEPLVANLQPAAH